MDNIFEGLIIVAYDDGGGTDHAVLSCGIIDGNETRILTSFMGYEARMLYAKLTGEKNVKSAL